MDILSIERNIQAKASNKYDKVYDSLAFYFQRKVETVDYIISKLSQFDRSVVLDLGCGTGTLLSLLAKFDSLELNGVDVSIDMIEVARGKTKGRVKLLISSADCLGFKNQIFDAIVGTGVLHHLQDLKIVFLEIERVLKPGGIFLFIEPSAQWIFNGSLRSKVGRKKLGWGKVLIKGILMAIVKVIRLRNYVLGRNLRFEEEFSPVHRHLTETEVRKAAAIPGIQLRFVSREVLGPVFEGVITRQGVDRYLYKMIKAIDNSLEKYYTGIALYILGRKSL